MQLHQKYGDRNDLERRDIRELWTQTQNASSFCWWHSNRKIGNCRSSLFPNPVSCLRIRKKSVCEIALSSSKEKFIEKPLKLGQLSDPRKHSKDSRTVMFWNQQNITEKKESWSQKIRVLFLGWTGIHVGKWLPLPEWWSSRQKRWHESLTRLPLQHFCLNLFLARKEALGHQSRQWHNKTLAAWSGLCLFKYRTSAGIPLSSLCPTLLSPLGV